MKLGVVKTISKEELARAGELPKWIDALLDPLNQFIEKAGSALQGRLTFRDNSKGKESTQKLVHNVEKEINPFPPGTKSGRIIGVFPIDTNGEMWTGFSWSRKASGNISVKILFNAAGSTEADVVLRIELE